MKKYIPICDIYEYKKNEREYHDYRIYIDNTSKDLLSIMRGDFFTINDFHKVYKYTDINIREILNNTFHFLDLDDFLYNQNVLWYKEIKEFITIFISDFINEIENVCSNQFWEIYINDYKSIDILIKNKENLNVYFPDSNFEYAYKKFNLSESKIVDILNLHGYSKESIFYRKLSVDQIIILIDYHKQLKSYTKNFEDGSYSVNYSYYYNKCLLKNLVGLKEDKRLCVLITNLIKYGSLIICRKKSIYISHNKIEFLDFSKYFISPIENNKIGIFNVLENESYSISIKIINRDTINQFYKSIKTPIYFTLSFFNLNKFSLIGIESLKINIRGNVFYLDKNCSIKDYLREISFIKTLNIKDLKFYNELIQKMIDNKHLDFKLINYEELEFEKKEMINLLEKKKNTPIAPLVEFVLSGKKNDDIIDFIKFIAIIYEISKDVNLSSSSFFKESVFSSQIKIKIPQNSYLFFYLLSFSFSSTLIKEFNKTEDFRSFKFNNDKDDFFDYRTMINDGLDDLNNIDPDWEWNID